MSKLAKHKNSGLLYEDSDIAISDFPEYSLERWKLQFTNSTNYQLWHFEEYFRHPRQLQSHKLTNLERPEVFTYKKNRDYYGRPNEYKYSRRCGDRKEVLCQYCTHYKWVDLESFKYHLLFGHGVLTMVAGGTFYRLKSLPRRVMECKDCKFTNVFVECGLCKQWVLLGKRFSWESNEFLDAFGFYCNYFTHVCACH